MKPKVAAPKENKEMLQQLEKTSFLHFTRLIEDLRHTSFGSTKAGQRRLQTHLQTIAKAEADWRFWYYRLVAML